MKATEEELKMISEFDASDGVDEGTNIYMSDDEIIDFAKQYHAKQLILHDVSVVLPKLITENHDIKWMAYLEGLPLVATEDTEELAIESLMLLIKIKLIFDKSNER